MGYLKEKQFPESEPNPEKISSTAKLAAYLRTFSDIPYSHQFAQATNSQKVFDAIGEFKNAIVPYAPIMEARFKGVSEIIEDRGITNVLEIACGISPRGLIMTMDPSVVYVESDLKDILREEEALVSGILTDSEEKRQNLHFLEANVLDTEQVLSASHVLSDPVAVVSEGLFAYFTRDEKLVAAKNIRQVLDSKGGIWITPDLYARRSAEELTNNPKVRIVIELLSESTGRELEDNMFLDEDDIAHFVNEAGFATEEFDLSSVMGKLNSIENSGADHEQILRILKKRKVHILKPG